MNKVRGNYKNMPENKAAGWICVGCTQEAELNSHIMTCKAYEDDRSGLNMDTDRGLVEYFRKVMVRRSDIMSEKE